MGINSTILKRGLNLPNEYKIENIAKPRKKIVKLSRLRNIAIKAKIIGKIPMYPVNSQKLEAPHVV